MLKPYSIICFEELTMSRILAAFDVTLYYAFGRVCCKV
jgi:hypothetical protein